MTRFYAFDPYTAVWRLIARDGCDYVVPTRSRIIGTRHGDEQNDLHVSMLYFHPKCAENGKDAKALLTETNGTSGSAFPMPRPTPSAAGRSTS